MLKKIRVSELALGMYIHEFCRPWGNDPFWIKHVEVELQDVEVLKLIQQSTTKEVWIDTARGKRPDECCGSQDILQGDDVVDTEPTTLDEEINRAQEICNKAKTAVMGMFTDARMGRAMDMEDVALLVGEISNSIMRHPHALISLSRLKNSDEYTYMHSVAVCALMIALARRMGMSEDQVREAGAAGLLHDVGKMMIPIEILNKPGSLTREEFLAMKKHPEEGLKILQENRHVIPSVMDVCLHHHEKVDGSGYPHGLAGEEISLLSRMGAVCDVYDAVTSERPYKKGWGAAHSIREMATWKGHFDEKVFQSFVKTVGIYPVGALVRLESGRLGVVVEQNDTSLLLPKVKVFMSALTRKQLEPKVINLASQYDRDPIVRIESPDDWGISNVDEIWCKKKL
jgi:putative nucleotidyltransferase with HDIG domain